MTNKDVYSTFVKFENIIKNFKASKLEQPLQLNPEAMAIDGMHPD